jgi:peptidoglycan/xylan/chitin deacetylase (PgdA/CDA1 family)
MNPSGAIPILYYHSVADNCLSVNPLAFRAQLSYLKQHGYRCINLGEWLASQGSMQAAERRVVLTFDDGFGSMWENVLPLLKEFCFRATFFIVPGYVGKTLWGDPLTRRWSLEEKPGRRPFPMMSWDQIVRMSEARMEIGSHTLSHPNLTDIAEEEARKEIHESKAFLEEKLGIPMQGFCYPRGCQNDALVKLVQESGYHYGCTTTPGYATPDSNSFALPRIPGPVSLSDLVFQLKRIPANILTTSALRAARYAETLRLRVRATD